MTVLPFQKPAPSLNQFQCTNCKYIGDGCDCANPNPVLFRAGDLAAEAIRKPENAGRPASAIAADIGVGHATVSRERKAVFSNEKIDNGDVIRKDGKKYPATRKPPAKKSDVQIKHEQPIAPDFFNAPAFPKSLALADKPVADEQEREFRLRPLVLRMVATLTGSERQSLVKALHDPEYQQTLVKLVVEISSGERS